MFNTPVFIAILFMIFIFPSLLVKTAYKSLREKGDKKGIFLLALGVGLGLAYFAYSAFYPTDGICKDRYERYSSLKFPRTGKILEKEASMINDIKGSFTDCYLVSMSPEDYNQSLNKLRASGKFASHDSFLVYTPQYKKVESKAAGAFAHLFSDGSKAYTFLGFLKDGKTILINIVGRNSELHRLPPVSNHRIMPQGK